jgi:3-methyladenine DNA glycosylase AlkD
VAEEIVAKCGKRLRDAEPYVRSAAAEALGQMGANAATPEVLSLLVPCLRDAEPDVRSAAAWALQQLSVHPQQERSQAIQLVLPLVTSRDSELRNTGYVCLRNLLAGENEVG